MAFVIVHNTLLLFPSDGYAAINGGRNGEDSGKRVQRRAGDSEQQRRHGAEPGVLLGQHGHGQVSTGVQPTDILTDSTAATVTVTITAMVSVMVTVMVKTNRRRSPRMFLFFAASMLRVKGNMSCSIG